MAESSPLPVIPGDAADDGNAGPENGLGQRHSGAPQAFKAGHDGQRVHAGAPGERTGDGRNGIRDAHERRRGVIRRFATKSRKCFDVTSAKLLKGMVGAAGFEPTTSTV